MKHCFKDMLVSLKNNRRNMAIATKKGTFFPKAIIDTVIEELEEDTRSVAMTMHQALLPILG